MSQEMYNDSICHKKCIMIPSVTRNV